MIVSEDIRAAVNITTNLSGQLIAAALAMLAIEGGVVSFVYGQRETEQCFIYLIVLAAVAFVSSIYLAGKGITKLRDSGLNGSWNIQEGKYYFNSQAILCLVGLCCFFISAFLIGKTKDNEMDKKIASLDSSIAKLKLEFDKINDKHTAPSIEVKNNKVEAIRSKKHKQTQTTPGQ